MAVVNVIPLDLDAGNPELDEMVILVFIQVWPFRLNTGKSGETLEWLTDVLSGFTGEQRLALRDAPRQGFEYSHTLESHDFTRAKNYARQHTYMRVPVWAERTRLTGNLTAAATEILFDTANADYRVGSNIIVWENPDKTAVALVNTVNADKLILSAALGTDFATPIVAPLRTALVVDGLKTSRKPGAIAESNIRFLAINNIDLAGSIGYPQYQSLDVMIESTVVIGDISETIINTSEFIDSGLGPIVIERAKDYADFGQTLGFYEQGIDRLWRRRQWLHSLKGKQKSFWLPSFIDDLVLLTPIGASDTTITVERIGVPGTFVGRHIMIETTPGTRYFREITLAVDGGVDEMDLTISSSLGTAVSVESVSRFSILSKVRLNSDRVRISYLAADVVTLSVPVTEVVA